MGELLNQHRSQAQLLLIHGIGELLAVAIADVEPIVQFAVLDLELRLGDVNVAHGQRIGKRIEKGGGIVRLDLHHGICRRLTVVERDVDSVEKPAE
ncbi:MAG: hypothetical protein EWM72_01018 [Nitrospira sp.]|nr:MAG: hypothetical protein EWM72_01018 [Nitrospira sp.]